MVEGSAFYLFKEGAMFVECLEDNFYEQYVKEPTRGVISRIW